MKGMFFAHLESDKETQGRVNVRTGVVKAALGPERYLLDFTGKNYRFAQVFNAEQLQAFSFFDTEEALQAFLSELRANAAPPPPAESPGGFET